MNKILCIDDDPDMLRLLVNLLNAAGYEVSTASDPETGLAAAKNAPDVILLDVMLPGMNGYEVCAALQKDPAASGAPVVFLSALSEKQDKLRALAVGGADYLTKPFRKETLLAAIKQNLLKKEAWAPGRIPAPAAAGTARPRAAGSLSFSEFKKYALAEFSLDGVKGARLAALKPAEIYNLAELAGATPKQVAQLISSFTGLPYVPIINPDEIKLGVMPLRFARLNKLIALQSPGNSVTILLPHPFDF